MFIDVFARHVAGCTVLFGRCDVWSFDTHIDALSAEGTKAPKKEDNDQDHKDAANDDAKHRTSAARIIGHSDTPIVFAS